MTKKKIAVITIIIFILFGGMTTYFILQHQTEVHAQELIKQKKEESLKKEKKNLTTAETAVTTAFKTRNDEDIEIAITAIDKLNKKQDSNKTRLTNEMDKLKNWLAVKIRLETVMAKAEKSKSEADINEVKTLLETRVDDSFKDEKKVFQDKLIALEEERKKAQEETEVSKEQAQQEQVSSYNPNFNQASSYNDVNSNYTQTPSDNGHYQAPVKDNDEQPVQQEQAQQPPSSGGTSQNNNAQDSTQQAQNNNNGIMGNEAPNGAQMETPGWGF